MRMQHAGGLRGEGERTDPRCVDRDREISRECGIGSARLGILCVELNLEMAEEVVALFFFWRTTMTMPRRLLEFEPRDGEYSRWNRHQDEIATPLPFSRPAEPKHP